MSNDTQTIQITTSRKLYLCGDYKFENRDGMLIVFEPRINTPNDPQNHYNLRNLPNNQWFALKDFRGDRLPIYIYWNRVVLQVRVGTPPLGQVAILPVSNYSQERSFEAQLNGIHVHPAGGFWLRYHNSYPHPGGSVMVKADVSGEAVDFPIDRLPEHKWLHLSHLHGGMLPVKVYRDQNKILAEWLSADANTNSDISSSAPWREESPESPNPTVGNVAKVVGGIAVIGLTIAAQWLNKKSSDSKK